VRKHLAEAAVDPVALEVTPLQLGAASRVDAQHGREHAVCGEVRGEVGDGTDPFAAGGVVLFQEGEEVRLARSALHKGSPAMSSGNHRVGGVRKPPAEVQIGVVPAGSSTRAPAQVSCADPPASSSRVLPSWHAWPGQASHWYRRQRWGSGSATVPRGSPKAGSEPVSTRSSRSGTTGTICCWWCSAGPECNIPCRSCGPRGTCQRAQVGQCQPSSGQSKRRCSRREATRWSAAARCSSTLGRESHRKASPPASKGPPPALPRSRKQPPSTVPDDGRVRDKKKMLGAPAFKILWSFCEGGVAGVLWGSMMFPRVDTKI